MEPIEISKAIPLKHVRWERTGTQLDPQARTELDALAERLTVNPDLSIELAVHADARGDATDLQNLTQKRAEALVDYLKSKGVAKERLVAEGYGSSRPLNHCVPGVTCTEEEHAVNRRNEYKVLAVKLD
jgi:outer membrane protein OmpA-like peptidoglycan-associated protein